MRRLLLVLLAALLAAATAAPAAEPRTLTVGDCVSLALKINPDVAELDADVDVATAERAGAGTALGPRLHVDAGIQRWDSPLAPSLAGATFQVRDATTGSITVTAMQPLTPLWSLYDARDVRELDLDVARLRREGGRRDLALQVVVAFYRYLEARDLMAVAAQSVEQLAGHAKRSRELQAQGVVAKNDVLRAELAEKSARQRLLSAQSASKLAAGKLALLVGLAPDTVIAPTGVPTEPPPRDAPPLAEAQNRALGRRAEVQELATKVTLSAKKEHELKMKWIPQVMLVGSYQLTEGSKFADENAFFAGLALSWDVWDGGALKRDARVEAAHSKHAVASFERVQGQLLLEVQSAWQTYDTAADALDLARSGVADAEENFRIETSRYESSAATTLELLDAEALVTQARAQWTAALYDYLIARSALAHAMGGTPEAIAAGELK